MLSLSFVYILILYIIHYTLYIIHYTLYIITLYIIHLYIIHYTLYIIHYTLYIVRPPPPSSIPKKTRTCQNGGGGGEGGGGGSFQARTHVPACASVVCVCARMRWARSPTPARARTCACVYACVHTSVRASSVRVCGVILCTSVFIKTFLLLFSKILCSKLNVDVCECFNHFSVVFCSYFGIGSYLKCRNVREFCVFWRS